MVLRRANKIINENSPHPEESSEKSQRYVAKVHMGGWFANEYRLDSNDTLRINEYYTLGYDDGSYLVYQCFIGCPVEYLIEFLNRTMYLSSFRKVVAINTCNKKLRNIQ